MTALEPPKTVKAYNNGNFQRNQTQWAEEKNALLFKKKRSEIVSAYRKY